LQRETAAFAQLIGKKKQKSGTRYWAAARNPVVSPIALFGEGMPHMIVPITLLGPLASWEQGLLVLLMGASAINLILYLLRNRARRHEPFVGHASTSGSSSPGRVLTNSALESLSMRRENKANPLDRCDGPQPQAAEQFSKLCESMKDAAPEEQASRMRQHFGVLGGARPLDSRRRRF
jgi:hypothetical protein